MSTCSDVALSASPAPFCLDLGVRMQARGEQRPGVGLARVFENFPDGPLLDDAPALHDHDAMREIAHQRQVVGDEDVGEVELVLEAVQERDHLGLDGDVEGRNRLVADDQLRLEGQSAGDGDALALAARELVWIAADVTGIEADLLEEFPDSRSAIYPWAGSRGG